MAEPTPQQRPFARLLERVDEEITESFVRSSGPGGQNVNKVATAVEARFDASASSLLTAPQLSRLARIAGRRMTREGVLIVRAEMHRTQERNRAEAREKLLDLVERALPEPRRRVKTRTPLGENRKRLEQKARRSATKRTRSGRPDDD